MGWQDAPEAGGWASAPEVNEPSQAQAQAETGAWSGKLGRAAQGAIEPMMGAAQLASHVTGVGSSYMDKKVQEYEDFYQKSRTAAGLKKDDWDYWAGAGNILSPINYLPGAAAESVGAAAARRLGAGALTRAATTGATAGAMGSAMQPVTNISPINDYESEKKRQIAMGGAGGALLGPAASMVGRGLIPEVAPAARVLAGEQGVPLTTGQMGGPGSWLKRLEDIGEKAPIVGGKIRQRREEALEGLNTSIYNSAEGVLAPVGEKIPNSIKAGHDAFNFAEDVLSQKYDDLHPKLKMSYTDELKDELQGLFHEHSIDLVEPRQKQLMNFINKKIVDRIDAKGGFIEGSDIQKITSELAHQGRKWAKATDPDQQALGEAFRDVRLAINSALEAQNPQFAPELRKINTSWARLMTIEPAVAATASAARNGVFTPTQLEMAVKKAASQRQMARGTAWGQETAEAAKQVLPSNIGSSGTEERRSTMDLLAGLAHGSFNPGTGGLVGLAAVPLLYSKTGQALIRNRMLNSQGPGAVRQSLGRYAPTVAGLGIAANQAGIGQAFADKALGRPKP
jgi:hypothetical protein